MLSRDRSVKGLIDDLIRCERTARDTVRWQDMTDCYSPDSSVGASCFQGSSKDFAKLSSKTLLPLDGVQASMTSFTRLLSRARKSEGKWRIAGLQAVYIRDQLEPCNPAEVPKTDLAKLNQHRLSYRHLSHALKASHRPLRDNLPGVDRPRMVSALRVADRKWLHSQDA